MKKNRHSLSTIQAARIQCGCWDGCGIISQMLTSIPSLQTLAVNHQSPVSSIDWTRDRYAELENRRRCRTSALKRSAPQINTAATLDSATGHLLRVAA
jgi:hypothetical protein